jgi:hypothetical protein
MIGRNMEEPQTARSGARTPALIGIALIVGGFVLAELAVEVLFSSQDPAGKGMAGGLFFFAFLIAGVVFLILASVRAIRGRAKSA